MGKLEETVAKLNEKFGSVENDTYITSGSVIFDEILSKGKGIPQKKFISLSSPSGAGKSTGVLYFMKWALQQGKKVLYLDIEKGVNMDQLEGIGISEYLNKNLFIVQASCYEDAEEAIDAAITDPDLVYVVVDSITNLIARKMLDRSVEQYDVGTDAQLTSKFLKKYKTKLQESPSKATFIFINQYRTKIRLTGPTTEGEAGGNALKFNMDIRLCMRVKEKLEKKALDASGAKIDIPYGARVDLWAEKNRHNLPFIHGVMTILYGKGISNLDAYYIYLKDTKKVLKMSGAGFYSLELPDYLPEPVKARGENAMRSELVKIYPKLVQYVKDQGGFGFVQSLD